jgi:hypothetical protein
MRRSILTLVGITVAIGAVACAAEASDAQRRRVLISTDIGGTDPDDFQSLIHYLISTPRD